MTITDNTDNTDYGIKYYYVCECIQVIAMHCQYNYELYVFKLLLCIVLNVLLKLLLCIVNTLQILWYIVCIFMCCCP
jgi:hypothetical protein